MNWTRPGMSMANDTIEVPSWMNDDDDDDVV